MKEPSTFPAIEQLLDREKLINELLFLLQEDDLKSVILQVNSMIDGIIDVYYAFSEYDGHLFAKSLRDEDEDEGGNESEETKEKESWAKLRETLLKLVNLVPEHSRPSMDLRLSGKCGLQIAAEVFGEYMTERLPTIYSREEE
jgi:hypothetical protein